MKTREKETEEEKKKGRQRFWALVAIILLLLLLFTIFQCQISERKKILELENMAHEDFLRQKALELAMEQANRKADSLIAADLAAKARADSIAREDSLMGTINDSLANRKGKVAFELERQKMDSIARAKATADSIAKTRADSIAKARADSIVKARTDSIARTKIDTLPPQPSMLPPPGRYYKPINLRVDCGEPKCETEISIGDSLNPIKGTFDNYNKTGKVYFRAIDSTRRASAWEFVAYDMASDNKCAENSFPVPVKGKNICVDAYEFPNKPGEKPRNMISHEAASRQCEIAGKRLCSAEEWQAACKGNSNSRYPYGNTYNQRKCATDLKSAKEPNRSGFAEHCRSYFGMYDMSGNLWEWTSTPAQRDGLFVVAGGAWNTQNASSCTETKFSFYPQNEYPFVGFRCCL